ncbi:hypothetical protein AgCh_011318 [Apium graveolens]
MRETHKEVNLSKTEEDEPTLPFTEFRNEEMGVIMLNQEQMIPDLKRIDEGRESQVWFLDNRASNHMTGQREKFKDIDESVNGLVRFRDGSTVNIKGKGTVAFKCKNREAEGGLFLTNAEK